jgi:hypothetical protein
MSGLSCYTSSTPHKYVFCNYLSLIHLSSNKDEVNLIRFLHVGNHYKIPMTGVFCTILHQVTAMQFLE